MDSTWQNGGANYMNEVKVEFVMNDFYCSVANVNELRRVIRLNLPKMVERANLECMTFNDFFATCISHELIHQLIFDIESDSASGQFDNICRKKYKYLKHWIGGVGSGQ